MLISTLPAGDIAYFILRIALSSLTAAAAARSLVFAWEAYHTGWPWRVACGGGGLLVAGALMSAIDAVDNVLLRPHDPIPVASWLWLFVFDLLLPVWTLLLVAAWRARDKALDELSRLSVTDQLTGALNRRGFFERAAAAIAQARRTGLPAALIMFDIDHFKAVNDGHGHAAGDAVLRGVVQELSGALRTGDLLGRLGGEEFAVFLPNSTATAAFATAERLRLQVQTGVEHPEGAASQITLSGGIAVVPVGLEPEAALVRALKVADDALYAAKETGRNRVMLSDPPAEALLAKPIQLSEAAAH